MITFSNEIRCIWQRKFTGATVLFILNRYVFLFYLNVMVVTLLPAWQTVTERTASLVSFSLIYLR